MVQAPDKCGCSTTARSHCCGNLHLGPPALIALRIVSWSNFELVFTLGVGGMNWRTQINVTMSRSESCSRARSSFFDSDARTTHFFHKLYDSMRRTYILRYISSTCQSTKVPEVPCAGKPKSPILWRHHEVRGPVKTQSTYAP